VLETDALVARFQNLFPGEPRLFRAPGRVNLIGEHTDYNDGFVLPIAINLGTTVAAAGRNDKRVRIHSINLEESLEFDLDHPGPRCRGIWLDYVEGVAQALVAEGVPLMGADMILGSDVSLGGGLSSSAALEMSAGMALLALSGRTTDRKSLALAGQTAEHTYVGTKCGIMDQFVGAMGRAGHALLIDCRRLEGKLIPFRLRGIAVVVCNTKVKHSLASSQYNTRRAECERGVEILREPMPGIQALRDVTLVDFLRHQDRLPEPVRRRCRHVISENERTLAAARALESGALDEMGRLMNASHESLRDDYEVSCRELDVLVEAARSVSGVAGARMTGAGFGGCTVNLVKTESLDRFRATVTREYLAASGLTPDISVVESSDGASEISRQTGPWGR
jgi:galactokinase